MNLGAGEFAALLLLGTVCLAALLFILTKRNNRE